MSLSKYVGTYSTEKIKQSSTLHMFIVLEKIVNSMAYHLVLKQALCFLLPLCLALNAPV